MRDRLPWITFPALDRLKGLVRPTDKVFEYGGGGSTLYWCDHAAEVITVEHDASWYSLLQEAVEKSASGKWQGSLVPPGEGDLVTDPDPSDPQHFSSADEPSRGRNYKAYVEVIDRYPNGYFDILLIDGRARTSCLWKGVPKVRKGGLVILDNAERDYYTRSLQGTLEQLEVVLEGMAPVIYSPDLSETRIYRKR